ncbi:MBOAT family O-acyltransferase [Kaistia algarum]|uniref:MBOAT family O-acyltransferase n=1 Tax=Kaistia algarum TaxID=2083279 RepID=UPI0014020808|nr:MBOAT family protein [Kaistia algarum]MCX5515100.1 MBOAT family protein [Kaistia algarum]
MLFSSPEFIFLFLPVVVAVTYLIGVYSDFGAKLFLIVASAYFYTVSGLTDVIVLALSLLANFALARAIERGRYARLFLAAGILFDVAVLGYFKYFNFITDTINTTFGREIAHGEFRHLPLAISFFTFQQIAFLIDVKRRNIERPNLLNYIFFLFFFPHLIAGPITSYLPISRQIELKRVFTPRVRNICFGCALFAIGLAKKVLIADPLGNYVRPFFAMQSELGIGTSWLAAFAYSFQIYFDFSGYSDMAIGLGMLFNIRLPLNFASPYKSHSIQEFWRRWHITLSNWLRDYVYISLGGNRRGGARTYLNLVATMLIGGIWHGAGWGFVLWGLMHGLALAANRWYSRSSLPRLPASFAWPLTFLFVTVTWVLFRSANLSDAGVHLSAMVDLPSLATDSFRPFLDRAAFNRMMALVVFAGVLAFLAPTATMIAGATISPDRKIALRAAILAGILFGMALVTFTGGTSTNDFIYFRF